jgi:hypothetical protein
MREGIGSVFLYNIIITFIIIVFAFLAGTLSYTKAFKVNTKIVSAIEKYEGYNNLSNNEINKALQTLGYRISTNNTCPKRDGKSAMTNLSNNYKYCVYEFSEGKGYRTYGVVSYISIDIPIIGGLLQIPIYSRTIKMYNF